MKLTTRMLSLLMALLMVLSFATACNKDGAGNTEEPPAEGDPTLLTVANYKVVYGRAVAGSTLTRISELQYEIEQKTGKKILAEKDTSRNEIEDDNFEILIGDTSRVQSGQANNKLNGKNGYVIQRIGNKVAINASSDYMLEKALDYFAENVVGKAEKDAGVIPMAEEFSYTNTGIASVRFLGGIGGALKYKLIYSSAVDTDPNHPYFTNQKDAEKTYQVDYVWTQIQTLPEAFATLTGKTVSPVTDKAAEDSTYIEVLIGKTNRELSKELYEKLAPGEYGVLFRDNQIAIGFQVDSHINQAFDFFKSVVKYCTNKAGAVYLPTGELFSQRFVQFADGVPEFTAGEFAGANDSGAGTLVKSSETGTLQMSYKSTTENDFNSYCSKLEKSGYKLYFENSNKNTDNSKKNLFKTYTNEENMVHVYFVGSMGMTRVVTAKLENVNMPNVTMESYNKVTDSKMTQMRLAYDTGTFGMCYIFTLEDGSFILFDGGQRGSTDETTGVQTESYDHIRLYDVLTSLNKRADKKIVIAAWVLTHQHGDHYGNFVAFAEKYGQNENIVVEKCILNFASRGYMYNSHNPHMGSINHIINVGQKFLQPFEIVEVHTGQKIWVRNAMLEVLYTQEDLYPDPLMFFNNSSLVTRVHINKTNGSGSISSTQTVMMLGDLHYEGSLRMQEMYGDDVKSSAFLKSDVVQVAHHGYNGCTFELYKVIAPSVVFFPVSQKGYNTITKTTYGGNYNIKGTTYKPGQVNYNIINNLTSVVKDGSGNKAIKVADQYNWTLNFPFTASSIGNYLKNNTVPAGPSGNGAYPH